MLTSGAQSETLYGITGALHFKHVSHCEESWWVSRSTFYSVLINFSFFRKKMYSILIPRKRFPSSTRFSLNFFPICLFFFFLSGCRFTCAWFIQNIFYVMYAEKIEEFKDGKCLRWSFVLELHWSPTGGFSPSARRYIIKRKRTFSESLEIKMRRIGWDSTGNFLCRHESWVYCRRRRRRWIETSNEIRLCLRLFKELKCLREKGIGFKGFNPALS